MTRTSSLFLAVLAVAACQREATSPGATSADLSLPAEQVIYGLEHNMTTSGIRKAVVRGDTAYVQDQGRLLNLMGVDIDFFDETGRASGELTSTSGVYNTQGGEMVARGNVVLITTGAKGKRRLETEELHFDPQGDRIWSTTPFVLREGGGVTRGKSFRSDTQFKNFTVQGARSSGTTLPGGLGGQF